jgi:hypothetical protein
MKLDIISRRREVFLLFITVILLALLVSLLSNVLFSYLFEINRTVFSLVISVLLFLVAIFGYFVVLSRKETGFIEVEYPYCFDRSQAQFIDIPHCPASVNVRVAFEKLSLHVRREMTDQDKDYKTFFKSSYERFLNEATQNILLFILFGGAFPRREYYRSVGFDQLPKDLRKNECINNNYQQLPHYTFWIPGWANFESDEKNDWSILIQSKFGKILILWKISWENIAILTEPYVSFLGLNSKKDVHDLIITASLTYDCRLERMFAEGLREYSEWVNEIVRKFEGLDWKNTRDWLSLDILSGTLMRFNRNNDNKT